VYRCVGPGAGSPFHTYNICHGYRSYKRTECLHDLLTFPHVTTSRLHMTVRLSGTRFCRCLSALANLRCRADVITNWVQKYGVTQRHQLYYTIDEISKFAGEITDETLPYTLLDTAPSPRLPVYRKRSFKDPPRGSGCSTCGIKHKAALD